MILNRSDNPGEAGFTLIEVIVALFILSLSSFVLLDGFSIALKVFDKTNQTARINNDLATVEFRFRKLVNSAAFPYWENEINGNVFNVKNENEKMILGLNDELYTFKHLEFVSIVYSDKGSKLTLQTGKGEDIEISAKWGSYTMKGDQ